MCVGVCVYVRTCVYRSVHYNSTAALPDVLTILLLPVAFFAPFLLFMCRRLLAETQMLTQTQCVCLCVCCIARLCADLTFLLAAGGLGLGETVQYLHLVAAWETARLQLCLNLTQCVKAYEVKGSPKSKRMGCTITPIYSSNISVFLLCFLCVCKFLSFTTIVNSLWKIYRKVKIWVGTFLLLA